MRIMKTKDIKFDFFPEWYLSEKEAEDTIKNLNTLKELSYYLKNNDEYIRRIAILRIQELKLKDAVDLLMGNLDDLMESSLNKTLAAWTIKSICLKWNKEIILFNKLLYNFTGKESFDDLYSIVLSDNLSSIKFRFSESIIDSNLFFQSEDSKPMEDTNIDTKFPINEWCAQLSKNFFSEFKVNFKKLIMKSFEMGKLFLVFILNAFKFICLAINKYVFYNFFALLLFIGKSIVSVFPNMFKYIKGRKFNKSSSSSMPITKYNYQNNSIYKSRKISLLTAIKWVYTVVKNIVYNLFYIVFLPFRIIYRKKIVAVGFFIAFCIFISFTSSGKTFNSRYLHVDIIEVEDKVSSIAMNIFDYGSEKFNNFKKIAGDFFELNNSHEKEKIITSETLKKFRVIAQRGLNLRKSPEIKTDNIINEVLNYNSIVYSLSKTEKDTSGIIWCYIKTPEGNMGWASAKWLEEIN